MAKTSKSVRNQRKLRHRVRGVFIIAPRRHKVPRIFNSVFWSTKSFCEGQSSCEFFLSFREVWLVALGGFSFINFHVILCNGMRALCAGALGLVLPCPLCMYLHTSSCAAAHHACPVVVYKFKHKKSQLCHCAYEHIPRYLRHYVAKTQRCAGTLCALGLLFPHPALLLLRDLLLTIHYTP